MRSMRRKSARNVSKTPPEKPAETSTRKSRRHSKRHRRSSSPSSSDDSDNVTLKTIAQQVAEVPEEAAPKTVVPTEEATEEPVWTVTPSPAPGGEIQKLKICLTRPTPTSPASPGKSDICTRRRRNKSGSNLDEDIASPEDKVTRKLRFRGSPGANVEEQEELSEEQEEKRAKGKSKTKHKSKSEKSPKIQDLQEQTQSEISENVQVTPQSPQAALDIRVDNESVSTIECETVAIDKTETYSAPQNTSDVCDAVSESSKTVTEETSIKDPEGNDENNEQLQLPPVDDSFEGCNIIKSSNTEDDSQEANTEDDSQEGFKGFEVDSKSTVDQKQQSENNADEEIRIQEEIVSEKSEEQVEDCEPTKQELVSEQEVELLVQDQNNSDCQIQESSSSIEQSLPENETIAQSDKNIEEQESSSPIEKPLPINETVELPDKEIEDENKTDSECKPKESDKEDEDAVQCQMNVEPQDCELKTESSTSSEETVQVNLKEKTDEFIENQSPAGDDQEEANSITLKEPQQADEDSTSVDAIVIDNSCTPSKEETSFNLTHSFSPDVEEIMEVNEELQNMKDQVRELFPTPPKVQRKRKWSNSSVGLELITPFSKKIDINTIKQFCPDLKLLEENEVKIDTREIRDRRKSLSDQKERRTDRKVSIEYKLSDTNHRILETQSSINSSEMEEVAEPETDNSNIIAMNRKISIVDDTASKLKPPPSPAKNAVSEVLFITNLVRPFTLKQLKELLERTGKIKENGFWTDRIKSKCYVYYETIEEAEATRNALHGVHWPIGNGKKLVIDFATPDDLENARNPAPAPPPPLIIPDQKILETEIQVPLTKQKAEEDKAVKERERHRNETHVREWDIGKEDLHRLRSRSRERESRSERNERRRHRRTSSPNDDFISRKQRKKEEDIPQKLMDDLFRKTKITPSIYWLPLTPEEISTKQQQRLLRMAEHKRRMEESSRSRGDYGRGAPYRRRYD